MRIYSERRLQLAASLGEVAGDVCLLAPKPRENRGLGRKHKQMYAVLGRLRSRRFAISTMCPSHVGLGCWSGAGEMYSVVQDYGRLCAACFGKQASAFVDPDATCEERRPCRRRHRAEAMLELRGPAGARGAEGAREPSETARGWGRTQRRSELWCSIGAAQTLLESWSLCCVCLRVMPPMEVLGRACSQLAFEVGRPLGEYLAKQGTALRSGAPAMGALGRVAEARLGAVAHRSSEAARVFGNRRFEGKPPTRLPPQVEP